MDFSGKNKIKFTLSEKKGIFIFVSLILLFLCIRLYIGYFICPDTFCDSTAFEKEIAAYEKGILSEAEKKKESYFNLLNPNRSFETNRLNPFDFDPNTITQAEMRSLGLTEKQVKMIENYRSKGGKFKRKEDFKKMYCISDREYELLSPYIKIASLKYSAQTVNERNSNYSRAFIVDLNEADTLDLQQLKGIGPVFSKRIVVYRELLGGFYDKKQLLEVNGFNEEMFIKIENSLIIDTNKIRKINLNTSSLNKMKKHPYLDYYQAKAIVSYRANIKPFEQIDEIQNVNLIYEETFNKIKPYLAIE